VVRYNDNKVVLPSVKIADKNNEIIESLYLNLENYAALAFVRLPFVVAHLCGQPLQVRRRAKAKRKVIISESEIDKLLTLIKGVLDLDIAEFKGNVEDEISRIELNFKNYADTTQYRTVEKILIGKLNGVITYMIKPLMN
jgi:hypothetical protein